MHPTTFTSEVAKLKDKIRTLEVRFEADCSNLSVCIAEVT